MPRNILLVDDDPDSRMLVAEALVEKGYRVQQAENGRHALELLAGGTSPPPDMILLDLMMPVMDGWQFLAARSLDPRLASIPVLVLSSMEVMKASLEPNDVHGIVRKPFDLDELVGFIEKPRKLDTSANAAPGRKRW